MKDTSRQLSTWEYLRLVGVEDLPPLTHPLDPGYDPATAESHIEQSSHLMAAYKLSTAAWLVANEAATRRKIAAARAHNVPTVTGGTPFEVAVVQKSSNCILIFAQASAFHESNVQKDSPKYRSSQAQ